MFTSLKHPSSTESAMRQFIRHPVDIPIEVREPAALAEAACRNVSHGGLALRACDHLEAGSIVTLRIPFVQPAFETSARVAWCSACDQGFDLGVEFLDADDAFRARMVEQVCAIESYRNEVERSEGRRLTAEEAAMEWIGRYAAEFPGLGAGA
jgi:hypothetical protein